MSAGVPPAVLFYLLDRHALLAMTRGGRGILCCALFAETDFGDGVATEIFIYFIFYLICHIR